jgi:hypothetical protein
MDAEGDQGADSHRDCVLDVGAMAVLIKEGDEQESDERARDRGRSDLRGDD